MQQFPDVHWEWPFESGWTVGRIRDQFCTCYDLNRTACCLYCSDVLLCVDRLISEVGGDTDQPKPQLPTSTARNLLQIHSDTQQTFQYSELVLTARFTITIPFYAWHTLKQEEYPDPAALAVAWQTDIQQLVQHLQDLFSIDRSEAESAEAMDKACCQVAFTEGADLLTTPFRPSQGFTDVPAQQELLRYVSDKLMPSARRIRHQLEGLPPDSAQGENYPVVAAWQAANTDNKDSGMQTYTCLLQSMLLLWKLAWTAINVSGTEQTPATETAITTIIEAVGGLCDQLKRYDQAAVDGATFSPPQAAMTGDTGAAAEQDAKKQAERHKSLSLMLLILVKRVLPLVVKGKTPEADVCCKIMSALMMKSQPSIYQAVAQAIVAKGRVAHTSCSWLRRLS
ncbi:hypothetical protein ABBQ38_007566 [Trebouxia sp. C0009 RCD-2024]